jgi:tRNA(Arg) A34 adenosine deaminase TadA
LKLAKESKARGDHPFGALLLFKNKIILTSQNTVVTDQDITAHAELNLIREAWRRFDAGVLANSTLYTSTEPCAMCTGGIYWAGVREVVYACSNQELSRIVGGSLEMTSQSIFNCGKHRTVVRSYPEMTEFKTIHKDFWGKNDQTGA